MPDQTQDREALRERILLAMVPTARTDTDEWQGVVVGLTSAMRSVMPVVDELLAELASTREELAKLRGSGYMVVKVPECTKPPGHGRHILITRSAACEGVGPIPHGYQTSHLGTFGLWVHCRCGHDFSDYGKAPSDWVQHQQKYGFGIAPSSSLEADQ